MTFPKQLSTLMEKALMYWKVLMKKKQHCPSNKWCVCVTCWGLPIALQCWPQSQELHDWAWLKIDQINKLHPLLLLRHTLCPLIPASRQYHFDEHWDLSVPTGLTETSYYVSTTAHLKGYKPIRKRIQMSLSRKSLLTHEGNNKNVVNTFPLSHECFFTKV